MKDKSTRRSVLGSIGALSTVGIVRAGGAKSRGKDEAEPLSENEIEYARGQLPRYLSGTILDGETTVLVSPPEIKSRYTTAHNIEHTLTIDEANSIREQARLEYIKEYGVDPRNPRAEVIDGNVLREEKIRELVDQGKLKPGSSADPLHKNDDISTNDATTGPEGGNAGGPIAVDGEIFLTVYPAADSEHSPSIPGLLRPKGHGSASGTNSVSIPGTPKWLGSGTHPVPGIPQGLN